MNHIQWKAGSKVTGDAEKIHAELEVIRHKNGNITPQAVVSKAKSKRSAMHKSFEWNDAKAANSHREAQARKLVRSIQVKRVESPNVATPVYSSVTEAANGKKPERKVYQSTEEALQDPVTRDEILGNAIRDAISYRRKYAQLQELAKVFTAMDDLVENFGG